MTHRDPALFDSRIADWLEGDPNEAPDQALQVVLAAFPSIKPRRVSRLPWRSDRMQPITRAASMVVVAAIVVGGAWLLLRPGADDNAAVAPSPSASPDARPSSTLAPSTSPSPASSGSPTVRPSSTPAGTLPGGPLASTVFKPRVALELPAGWRLRTDDAELFWIDKGSTTLAFHLTAREVSADAAANLLGFSAGDSSLAQAPVAVTLGEAAGFTADYPGMTTGQETLFFKPGLYPFNGPRGGRAKAWVVGAGNRPVSITLSAMDSEYDAALAEVEAVLASLQLGP